MKVVRSLRSLKPEQEQETRLDASLRAHVSCVAEGFWDALCKCASVCLQAGYSALTVELLLMMAGDVERNPGPGE